MGDIRRRLCFYQFTFRIVVGCLIGGRIDLIKGFTRFNVAAFGKITVQNDTTYLGTNLRNTIRVSSAGQFCRYGQWRAFNNMNTDLRSLRILLWVFLPIAPGEQRGTDNETG